MSRFRVTFQSLCRSGKGIFDFLPSSTGKVNSFLGFRPLLLASMVLFLIGCAGTLTQSAAVPTATPVAPTASPQPAAPPTTATNFPLTVTDALGRSVTIPTRPQRIVSLAPSVTEILFAIGAGPQMVGRTKFDNYPAEATKLPDIGGFSAKSISVEAIVNLKPDLVIAGTKSQKEVVEALEKVGIPVYTVAPATVAEIENGIGSIGEITGNREGAAAVVKDMQARIAAITAKTESIPPDQRVRVFYEVFDEPLTTTSDATFIGEMLKLTGAKNIFGELAEQYPKVSVEEVVERDPQVIIGPSSSSNPVSVEKIKARPGWDKLTAVKTGAVYVVDGDMVSRGTAYRRCNGISSAKTLSGIVQVKSGQRRALLYLTLLVLLVVAAGLSLGVGAVSLTPQAVVQALMGSPLRDTDATIVWNFRLPRVLLVCVCGAALGAAGAGFQGLFRNPLADPSIIGASSGAALGATLVLVLGGANGALMPLGIAGFIGALTAVALVYAFAQVSGFGSVAALLLAGAAVGTMLSALASLLLLLNDEVLAQVFGWLLGGFGGRSWSQLMQALWIAPVGMVLLWPMARPLDALLSGEETAQALGVDLRWARFVIVGAASLATAAAVAAAGIIGFVGLISPHIARPLFGSAHAYVIPASMLIGALLMLLADDVARTLLPPLELPVGIFTALLGAPFFLILLRTRGRVR